MNVRFGKGFDIIDIKLKERGGLGHRLFAGDEWFGYLPISKDREDIEGFFNEVRREFAKVGLMVSIAAIKTDVIERPEGVTIDAWYGTKLLPVLDGILGTVKKSEGLSSRIIEFKEELRGLDIHSHDEGKTILKSNDYRIELDEFIQNQSEEINELNKFMPDEIDNMGAVNPEAFRKIMNHYVGGNYTLVKISAHFEANKEIFDYLKTKSGNDRESLIMFIEGGKAYVRFKGLNGAYGYLGADQFIALLYSTIISDIKDNAEDYNLLDEFFTRDIDEFSFIIRAPPEDEDLINRITAALDRIAKTINDRSKVSVVLEAGVIRFRDVKDINTLYRISESLKLIRESINMPITDSGNILKLYRHDDRKLISGKALKVIRAKSEISRDLLDQHINLPKHDDIKAELIKSLSLSGILDVFVEQVVLLYAEMLERDDVDLELAYNQPQRAVMNILNDKKVIDNALFPLYHGEIINRIAVKIEIGRAHV